MAFVVLHLLFDSEKCDIGLQCLIVLRSLIVPQLLWDGVSGGQATLIRGKLHHSQLSLNHRAWWITVQPINGTQPANTTAGYQTTEARSGETVTITRYFVNESGGQTNQMHDERYPTLTADSGCCSSNCLQCAAVND